MSEKINYVQIENEIENCTENENHLLHLIDANSYQIQLLKTQNVVLEEKNTDLQQQIDAIIILIQQLHKM